MLLLLKFMKAEDREGGRAGGLMKCKCSPEGRSWGGHKGRACKFMRRATLRM